MVGFKNSVISFFYLSPLYFTLHFVHAQDANKSGNERCPCINDPMDFVLKSNLFGTIGYTDFIQEKMLNNPSFNTSFGIGCAPHADRINYCEFAKEQCDTVIPQPDDCQDLSWCEWQWCFIDPTNCDLLHKESPTFVDLHESYATCGHMDPFVSSRRISFLDGRTLQVAFTSNTGGYQGAFNPEGSFVLNGKWKGPLVDFIRITSTLAGLQLKMVELPEFIQDEAHRYYDTSSAFDYCAYAASLGYVDLCVGSFTLTDKRAASGFWFNLGTDPIYLVSFLEKPKSELENFVDNAATLLKPFSWKAWLFIFFLVIPLFSVFVLFFDYGVEGGAFPKRDKKHLSGYIARSLYEVILSLFAGYEGKVVSNAGKVMILAIGFFNLTIIAVYTANLAAVLSANNLQPQITTLSEVKENGLRICANRRIADVVAQSHEIITDLLLNDPSDGLPGFHSRSRALDFMKDSVTDAEREIYCEAAVVPEEDLITMNGEGIHCNKTTAGGFLGVHTSAIPLSPRYHESLRAVLQKRLNEGEYQNAINKAKPKDTCSDTQDSLSSSEDLSLSHMSGIFLVTFGFALIGLIIHMIEMRKFSEKFEPESFSIE